MARALPELFRAAVYYAPAAGDALWARGCEWLGRDAETGEIFKPVLHGLAALTSEPRRYGFHATLKPPMQLAHGFEHFLHDVSDICSGLKSCALPNLRVQKIGTFIALVTSEPSNALQMIADEFVIRLDRHRVPETQAAQAKRASGKTAEQQENVVRFGYPYVLKDWQFHMTLSNSLERNDLTEAAQHYFDDVCVLPRIVDHVAVFVQPEPDAEFTLHKRIIFGTQKN